MDTKSHIVMLIISSLMSVWYGCKDNQFKGKHICLRLLFVFRVSTIFSHCLKKPYL
jgi:hypothetical protein